MPITMRVVMNRVPEVMARAQAEKVVAENETAEQAAELMRAVVAVDTGALRDSIQANGNEVEAGTDHAIFVEYGTSRMPAQPFFNQAIQDVQDDFVGRLVKMVVG